MGQFAFSEEEDDGSFVESMKNQSDQGDVEEFQLEKLTIRPDETPVVEIHIYTLK